jgi:hypothetical protein
MQNLGIVYFFDINLYYTTSVPQSVSFDFFVRSLIGSSYSKKFIIIIYFHSGLVYHLIYFNYELNFSTFSQVF